MYFLRYNCWARLWVFFPWLDFCGMFNRDRCAFSGGIRLLIFSFYYGLMCELSFYLWLLSAPVLTVWLSVCLTVPLSLSVFLSLCPPVSLCDCRSLSVCLLVCLLVCLYVCLSPSHSPSSFPPLSLNPSFPLSRHYFSKGHIECVCFRGFAPCLVGLIFFYHRPYFVWSLFMFLPAHACIIDPKGLRVFYSHRSSLGNLPASGILVMALWYGCLLILLVILLIYLMWI